MNRLTHLAIATACLLAVVSVPAKAVETFEVAHAASPAGRYPGGALHKLADGSFLVTAAFGGKGSSGGIYKLHTDGQTTLLSSFYGANGGVPGGGVIQATDSNYYGTTMFGGRYDSGTIFRMLPDGTLHTIATFTHANGAFPDTPLAEGSNGLLYGTTRSGGNANSGTAFKVTKAGALTVLAHFSGFVQPSGLVKGADGHFYGTTEAGGANNLGTVFRLTEAGVLTTVASFTGENGSTPVPGLVLGSDGSLYGATSAGGANAKGVFFRLTNQGVEVLGRFTAAIGAPLTGLLEAAPGEFYGVAGGAGTVFKATATGALTKVADFSAGATSYGASPLVLGNDGLLYGTTAQGGASNVGTGFRVSTAGVFTTFANFGSVEAGGFAGNLVKAPDGHLYGASLEGGVDDCGVFFKLSPGGILTKLADFTAAFGRPTSHSLILGADGNFYGTASHNFGGGPFLYCATPAGALTSVAQFSAIASGTPDAAGVMQASDGNFYGVLNNAGTDSRGIVYRYNPSSGLSALFDIGSLGATAPRGSAGPLVESEEGALYGASYGGGTLNRGAIFRVTTNGQFQVLANFTGKNGAVPNGPLIRAYDGNFYGMAGIGGAANAGVIYKVTPAGALSVLTQFTGFNGAFPTGSLVPGSGGQLYGVAGHGGNSDRGVLFKVPIAGTNKGKLTVLQHFNGENTGAFPFGGLTLGSDISLYGATYHTVFRLVLNNQPPVLKNDTFDLPTYGINVLKNDADADGDPLRVVEVTNGAHGTVEILPNNTLTYLPDETFDQTDTFTYKVSDGFSPPVTATVTIKYPVGEEYVRGLYAGLLVDSNGVPVGYWAITMTGSQSTFSSAVRLHGKRWSKRGNANLVNNRVDYQIPRKDMSTLVIGADLDPGRNEIVGTVSDGTQVYSMRLTRLFPLFSKADPTPRAGRYTMLLPPSLEMLLDPNAPHGTGFATLNVLPTGVIAITGKTGDGQPFVTASLVTRDNQFPLYAELYGGKTKGYLAGLVNFTPGEVSEAVAPVLVWNKPPQKSLNYPDGFTAAPGLVLSRYTPPKPGQMILPYAPQPLGNAALNFFGLPINRTINITARNVVTIPFPGPDRVNVVLNPATGLFAGKYTHPTDNLRRAYTGAVIQNQARGEGLYHGIDAGKNITGKVTLEPLED